MKVYVSDQKDLLYIVHSLRRKETMGYVKKREQRNFERKEFREYIKLSDDRVLDTKKKGIDLFGNDEIFVQVEGTNNYWISNYGRLINNIRKDKTFFFHKIDSGNPERDCVKFFV